jgi:hypothetical protein
MKKFVIGIGQNLGGTIAAGFEVFGLAGKYPKLLRKSGDFPEQPYTLDDSRCDCCDRRCSR